jgi:hypothetical protein
MKTPAPFWAADGNETSTNDDVHRDTLESSADWLKRIQIKQEADPFRRKMADRFPDLYGLLRAEFSSGAQRLTLEGFAVGPGWYGIIERLSQSLAASINREHPAELAPESVDTWVMPPMHHCGGRLRSRSGSCRRCMNGAVCDCSSAR